MKSTITWLLTILCFVGYAQYPTSADYVDPNPFPGNLTLATGDTLLITANYTTTWTSISVTGGLIYIYPGATLRVNGSLSVTGTGKVEFNGCESKLEVFGSYNGGYETCELEVYNCGCDTAINPFTLIWGVKVWDEWCCTQPLPIELVSFSGNTQSKYNEIFWVTASEINNDYFTIESSKDGFTWNEVAKIDGTNTYNLQYYKYTHATTDKLYYKLKQTDYDGTFTYSPIILLDRQFVGAQVLYRVNVLGQIVDTSYKGLVYIVYTNGMVKRIYQH